MQAQRQQEQEEMALLLALAEDSQSLLSDLGSIVNRFYGGNHHPPHETQQVLRRKNETISRWGQFLTKQRLRGRREQNDVAIIKNQQKTIERLLKQLQDQNAAFELERTRLQHQATVALTAQTELDSSLKRVLPQLRGLLDAYDQEHGKHVNVPQSGNGRTDQYSAEELNWRLEELEDEFDAERADLLEQVSDAANAQREIRQKNWSEREAALTCPISLDLFEDPVLTTCCGKTFSSKALTQALRQNHQCPVCRANRIATCANRDMASLVELHRTECLVLGLTGDTRISSPTVITENSLEAEEYEYEFMTSAARENPDREYDFGF